MVITEVMGRNQLKTWYYCGNGYLSHGNAVMLYITWQDRVNRDSDSGNTAVMVTDLSIKLCDYHFLVLNAGTVDSLLFSFGLWSETVNSDMNI